MAPPASQPASTLAIGIPTTTPIAFVFGEALYLERMSVLSLEGAGVLCETIPGTGVELPVVFRLSTAREVTRCRVEVVGDIPATPGGVALKAKQGEEVLPAITGAGVSDSATAIFRLGDLKPAAGPDVAVGRETARPATVTQAVGFAVRFLDLDPHGREAIDHHIKTSRFLADRLATQGGRSVKDERLAIAETFHEGDLSKRALDW